MELIWLRRLQTACHTHRLKHSSIIFALTWISDNILDRVRVIGGTIRSACSKLAVATIDWLT